LRPKLDADFIAQDLFVILTSSCARIIPRGRGYHSLSGSPHGRNRDRDAENRLIDQLDEEWDD
jgi:cation-dependent mannose-6-phosphate receptor